MTEFAPFNLLGADILTTLVFLPSVGGLLLALVSGQAKNTIRTIGIVFSGATLAVSAVVLHRFDPQIIGIEAFRVDRPWIPRFGIRYLLGIDGLSLSLILLTTGLLFLLVGVLYERRHTREMADYGGIASQVPVTTALFLIAALGSAGLPGLNGFVGEFLILGGVFQVSVVWCAIAATGMVLGAIYLLTLVQKVFWGPETNSANKGLTDINGWELAGALPLVVGIVWFGVAPAPLLNLVRTSADYVVQIAHLRMVP